MKFAMPFSRSLAVVACVVCLAAPASADDVLNAIDQARKSYLAGDQAAVRKALDSAAKLMTDGLKDKMFGLLPPTPPDWQSIEDIFSDGVMPWGEVASTPMILRSYTHKTKTYRYADLDYPVGVTLSIKPDPALAAMYIESSKDQKKAVANHLKFLVVGDLLVYQKVCPTDWCAGSADILMVRVIDNNLVVQLSSQPSSVENMSMFARIIPPAMIR